MITATRRIQFCSGHRVYEHESKCRNIHGHNYVVFITSEADELDSLGRVIDFSVLKEKVGGWIDEHWDHGFIAYRKDVSAVGIIQDIGTKLYLMNENPTAENMALHLLNDICPVLMEGTGVKITKITLWETENVYAEVS
mgnify:CR=1 FL=1